MSITIPTMRYWRIHCVRVQLYAWEDNVFRWAKLNFLDSNDTPIGSPAVTFVGASSVVDSTTPASLVDGSSATTVAIGRYLYSAPAFDFGGCTFQYDFGAPVQPSKLIVRCDDTLTTHPSSGSYVPWRPSEFVYHVYASENATDWVQVTVLQSVVSGFDIDAIVAFDVFARPYRYYYNTVMPFSGDGGIYGIVAEDGTPVQRPVILYERDSFTPIRRTVSTVDGAYQFENLNRDRDYMVMAVDTTEEPGQPGEYKNALVRDRITPIPANGVPTDGLPWFFRLRSTMKPRPNLAVNFAGPTLRHNPYMATVQRRWDDLLYDTAEGGGYDLRGLPLPVSPGLRLLYPRFAGPQGFYGLIHDTSTAAAFTGEIIAEVPSGADPQATFSFFGPVSGTSWQPQRTQYALVVELLPSGTLNVRGAFSASLDYDPVRATCAVTPGSVVHLLVCYSESQHVKVYVNGALAATGSLIGLGQLYLANHSGAWVAGTWNDGTQANGTNFRRAVDSISCVAMHGGTGLHGGSLVPTLGARLYTGVAWVAIYPGDLSFTPDAGGTPIAVRDLYSTYADGAVWTGGSRPDGWPVVPEFSGYGVEVAADAPVAWFRMQETNISQRADGYGSAFSGAGGVCGYYTGTGNTFERPGMTAGMSSVGIAAHGGLRVWGETSTTVNSSLIAGIVPLSWSGTAELWYRPASGAVNAERALIHTRTRDELQTSWYLYVDSAGRVCIRFRDSAGAYLTTTFSQTILAADTAYHLAVTWDNTVETKIRLYVDGALAEEQNFFTQFTNLPYDSGFTIGNVLNDPALVPPYNASVSASTYHANGDIQDVALYGYALPAARIAAHYAARNT